MYGLMQRMDWTLVAMLWATWLALFWVLQPLRNWFSEDKPLESASLWIRVIISLVFILAVGGTAQMIARQNGLS